MELENTAFVQSVVPYRRQPGYTRDAALTRPRQILTATTFQGSATIFCYRWRCHSRERYTVTLNPSPTECRNDKGKHESTDEGPQEQSYGRKFDPHSDTDAFGRDPRKETEFWMGAAKNVLDSDEVKDAIAKHAADGGDGLSDEQKAYMEFIKSLDAKKTDDK